MADLPVPGPDERTVLAAIRSFAGPVIVDLDETLYLQNSTADFIDCATPAVAALVSLKLLDVLAPWRWTGGRATRELWRVRLVATLFPWTMAVWRRRCRRRGPALVNAPLLQALRARSGPFVIATTGFASVVAPLVAALGCGGCQVIACSTGRPADRTEGKAALIEAALGADALARALFVTDSADDDDVLQRCAAPYLVRWASARFRRPFLSAYFPGSYTVFVKRPGLGGINGIVTTVSFWLLLTLTSNGMTPRLLPAVLLMFGSFWAIYEAGYLDNDDCARRYEANPVTSAEFADFDPAYFGLKAWCSALLLGACGEALLGHGLLSKASLAWLAFLGGTALLFRAYNRTDKASRIWLYLVLQCTRESGFLAFAAVGPAGALACAAHIIAKWQGYFIYRVARETGGKGWPETPHRTVRLAVFAVLLALYAMATRDASILLGWQAPVLLAFDALLARRELGAILASARRIDRPAAAPLPR